MQVIYILSSGHSGSTVLGALLGNTRNARHIGELSNLYKVSKGQLETCSCGFLPLKCSFWKQVLGAFNAKLSEYGSDFDEYEKNRKHVEGLIMRQQPSQEALKKYKLFASALFEILSQYSESELVIDSSKSPSRALALSKVFIDKMIIIHLKRQTNGVIYSFHRKYDKLRIRPFLWNLIKEHMKIIYALRNSDAEKIKVLYETIFEKDKVQYLFDKIGITTDFAADDPIYNTHVIAGNRLRYQSQIHLKPYQKPENQFKHFDNLFLYFTEVIRSI